MNRRDRHLRRLAIPLTAIAVVAAGCGIGSQDSVDRINPAQLGVLGTTPESVPPPSTVATASTTTLPAPVASTSTTLPDFEVPLYFVDGDRVVRVSRTVPARTSVRKLLSMLAQPPEDQGLRTMISTDLIGSLYRRGDLETLDLDSQAFNAVDPLEQPLLFAQLVLTLTSLPDGHGYGDIGRVQFTLDGSPMRAMRGDNTLAELGGVVLRDDYLTLLDG